MNYGDWLHQHRQQFIEGEYSLRDILALSFAVGDWTLDEMKRTLHHWPRGLWVKDPEASADRAGEMGVKHLVSTLKRLSGLSLEDQWSDLAKYLTEGREWGA